MPKDVSPLSEPMHICPHCGSVLNQRSPQKEEVLTVAADPLLVPSHYDAAATPKQIEKRKHKRIRGAFKAGIQVGDREDVVDLVDLSKGGLRFLSTRVYRQGEILQVAAPYTVGGNNE